MTRRRITAEHVREAAELLLREAMADFPLLDCTGEGVSHQARLVQADGGGWVVQLSLAPVDAAEMAEIRRRAEAP